jgi:L,D-peptidoglycan transpeptidase YkuD (ErfK/YbiS/YcfS/YnhG family)
MTAAHAETLPESQDTESRGRHRRRRSRRTGRRTAVVVAVGVLALTALGAGYVVVTAGDRSPAARDAKRGSASVGHSVPAAAHPGGVVDATARPSPVIPGLGPRTRAAIPAASRQVLVASGNRRNSPVTVVTLWFRTADGHWKAGLPWPAHNALRGWTRTHHAGDLHSPIGVFTLTDAGGFEPDPGSRLPYHHSSRFHAGGVGFDGEPLDEAFDYVIAINYNRVPGTSPLDATQPLGSFRGGGIWVHVDHGGPTHGCVSVSAAHMVELLRTLTPADHPVIVMGDAASLRS